MTGLVSVITSDIAFADDSGQQTDLIIGSYSFLTSTVKILVQLSTGMCRGKRDLKTRKLEVRIANRVGDGNYTHDLAVCA